MKYQVKGVQEIYQGRVFNITKTRLQDPAGREIWRETVVHPGAVAIIPQVSPNRLILIKQFRYPAGRNLWEIPAGTIDDKETPLECARRELAEETGYQARLWKKLRVFYTCPGFCTEKMHLYLARGLIPVKARGDDDEDIVCRIFTRREIQQLINWYKPTRLRRPALALRPGIIDAKTLIGLMIWLQT